MKTLAHLLLLLLIPAALGAAGSDIRFYHDFDNGSLLPENTRAEGDTVYFDGPDNFNPGGWKWIHFRMTGALDRALKFEIGNHYATGSGRLDDLVFVYSHDQIRWHFFDEAAHHRDEGVYRFFNNEPFAHDTVWVSFSLPYPHGRVANLVHFLRSNIYVFPTPSSDRRLVIGQSAGGTTDTGRTVPPLDLFGFKITDGEAGGEKEKVVIISGVHANETLGNHVTEGLLLFLVSEEPEAVELRQNVEFFVYPMVNPDGRYGGYNRGGVQHPRRDTNRFWHEELYADMKEIQTVGEAMKRDTGGGGVAMFFDFHSWSDTRPHFVIAEAHVRDTPFWTRLTEFEPEMRFSASRYGDEEALREAGRSTWFAKHRLGARHAMTPETMFRAGENIDRYRRMGRHFGLAMYAELVESQRSPAAREREAEPASR